MIQFLLPEEILNYAIPRDHITGLWDSCRIYNVNETLDLVGWNEGSISELGPQPNVTAECSQWVYDKSEYTSTAVTEFGLVCHRRWFVEFGMWLYIGGEVVGFLVFGFLSDRFGRRKMFFIALACQALAGLLGGMVTSLSGILAMRALLGAFSPGCYLGALLRWEFVGPSRRSFAASLDRIVAALAMLAAPAIAYIMRDWRQLQIMISIPGFVFLACWWFVPESARWLLAVKREGDGRKIVSEMASENHQELTFDGFEDDTEQVDWAISHPKLLCMVSASRLSLIITATLWLVNSVAYHAIIGEMGRISDNNYVELVLRGLIEVPGYIMCFFSSYRFGNKKPLFLSMVTSGGLIFSYNFMPVVHPALSLTLAIFTRIFLAFAFASIYITSFEAQPTVVRGASFGVNAACYAAGELLAPFILEQDKHWLHLPMVLLGCLCIVCGLLPLILPETSDKPLMETMNDYDASKSTRNSLSSPPEDVNRQSSKKHDNVETGEDAATDTSCPSIHVTAPDKD